MSLSIIETASVKPKKRVKQVTIPNISHSLKQAGQLPEDIKTVLNSGITRAALARSLGVMRTTVWAWERSLYNPRDPLIVFSIMNWAREIKRQVRKGTD